MKDPNGQNRRRKPTRDAPELRVVGIDVKPAPDAQDRLRRIFTILLEHAAGERHAAPDEDSLPEAEA